MRSLKTLLPFLFALALLAGCASSGKQVSVLERAQYDYSAAIRWGNFEGAWNLVDPKFREANPVTELQFERYKQIQVTSYRELASRASESEAVREIEIGLISRHTMAERTIRYVERWRYDAEAKRWWLDGGLPDFWAGE